MLFTIQGQTLLVFKNIGALICKSREVYIVNNKTKQRNEPETISYNEPQVQNDHHLTLNVDNSHTNVHSCTPLPQDKPNQLPTNSLKIIYWNINGTGSKHSKIYEEDIQKLLFVENDIIILTETHANADLNFENIPLFTFKNYPRKHIHKNSPWPSGGIGIFVRDSILKGIETYSTDESVVWIKLKSSFFGWEEDTFLACIYFSPVNSSYITSTNVNTNYFHILRDEVAKHVNRGNILICGDCNARIGQKQDSIDVITGTDGPLGSLFQNVQNDVCIMTPKRYSKDYGENEYGTELLDFCKGTGLITMNGRLHDDKNIGNFTYYHPNGGKSLIDFLLAMPSYMPNIDSFKVSTKRADSDHVPVSFSIKVPSLITKPQNTDQSKNKPINYKWNKSKLQDYRETFKEKTCALLLQKLIEHSADPECTSEQINNIFYEFLNYAIDSNFDKKHSKMGSKFPRNKWFDQECKAAKRKVNEYAKNHNLDLSENFNHLKILQTEYNRIRQHKKRTYEQDVRNKLDNMITDNPNAYWNFWNSLYPQKINRSELNHDEFEEYIKSQVKPPNLDYFDKEHMQEVENFVNKYFADDNIEDRTNDIDYDICNAPITSDEIKLHLAKLKNHKASGIDGIAGEFLKSVTEELVKPLQILFNHIFDRSEFPSVWAEGIIHPIHKKGSQNIADNYRKITVMSVVGKVYESIINSRLKQRNTILEINDENQFGFKENCRTTDNMFILNSLIDRQKFKKKPLYTCFVDFTKAFDYINRSALYFKLIQRGVKGKLLKTVYSMYNKATCRVKWKGKIGNKIDSEYGVLQGGMTSPFLFTEFLYDLKEYLDKEYGTVMGKKLIAYLLYADDLVLCAESAEDLQRLLYGLENFCKKWHLIVSLAKTKVMIFNKKTITDKFIYNGNEIEIVNKYKYLGTIFSSDTSTPFGKNMEHLSGQAQKALFALNTHINNNVSYLTPRVAFKMFDVHINPILQYGAEIWGNGKQIESMERLHLGYLKHVLQVKRSSCTPAMYAECGRFPIITHQKFQIIKYWQRILNLENTHILKNAYDSSLEIHRSGHENWCNHVKSILFSLNLECIWEEQKLDKRCLALLKEQLYNKYMTKTLENIHNSEMYPKLRTYKIFKEEYKLENYLTQLKDLRYIKSLIRFRISSHNLRIETGRYEREKLPCGKIGKLEATKRTCKICNSDKAEDEKHFLIQCPFYTHERTELFKIVKFHIDTFENSTDDDKFLIIMSCKEPLIIKSLGKYIYYCFKKRSQCLE